MEYTGPERRKHPRISGGFIVSYHIQKCDDDIDVSQTKNLSVGGMLLTTNRQFPAGTKLSLEISIPFSPHPILLTAQVLESREVSKNLIYDTRIQFLSVSEKQKKAIEEAVGYYLKRGQK